MKKNKILLLLLLLSLYSKAQIRDKETYRVLSVHLQGAGKVQGPYWLEEWSLPFKRSAIDMPVLSILFLKSSSYWDSQSFNSRQ